MRAPLHWTFDLEMTLACLYAGVWRVVLREPPRTLAHSEELGSPLFANGLRLGMLGEQGDGRIPQNLASRPRFSGPSLASPPTWPRGRSRPQATEHPPSQASGIDSEIPLAQPEDAMDADAGEEAAATDEFLVLFASGDDTGGLAAEAKEWLRARLKKGVWACGEEHVLLGMHCAAALLSVCGLAADAARGGKGEGGWAGEGGWNAVMEAALEIVKGVVLDERRQMQLNVQVG